MKIEIILTDSIDEECSGMTCFEADASSMSALNTDAKSYTGIVIIDGQAVKFSFSSLGIDGDIFTNNIHHRRLVKRIVPAYIYSILL